MPRSFKTLADLISHGADTVIDVRSPAEFAEDHIPGAINLPALSNSERADVGTIYVQDSAFKARKLGAALVARNVATHLEGPLAKMEGGWQPLVYCWRGGQRSGSFASILQQIGWRADTVAGGYKSYRRLVVDMLHQHPLSHDLILLDGNTGTGKTAILARLANLGFQTLDLEHLANHRGSLLGGMPDQQPSQKRFESRIAEQLVQFKASRPVLVEAESSKIGTLNIPPRLWSAMCAAPRIRIDASMEDRTRYLVSAYDEVAGQPDLLLQRLNSLRRIRGHAVVDSWQNLLSENDLRGLAQALIADHYDPAYEKARRNHDIVVLGTVLAKSLDAPGISDTADAIADIITQAT